MGRAEAKPLLSISSQFVSDAIRMGRAEAKHASQADEVLYGGDAIRMGRAEAK